MMSLFKQVPAILWCGLMALVIVSSGCSDNKPQTVELKGAGATFPYPAYSKWIAEYKEERPSVRIEYRPAGSTVGVEELAAEKIDFAGSDMPLSDSELAKFKEKPFHFPTLIGAVVPIYNVPRVEGGLNFTGDVLARILLGKIVSWSDASLTSINPNVKLPALPIKVVHRGDGSGTSFLLTEFLSKVSPQWNAGIGHGATVQWPVGQAVAGSEAVAETVAKTPGAIGYVELNYAVKHKLAHGAVQNQAGQFQKASFESLGAAIDSVQMASDFRTVAANASGKGAYPIAGLTYLLVPKGYKDPRKRDAMKRFLTWALSAGQKSVLALEYNLLPPSLLEKATNQIDKIR